VECAAAEAY